MPKKPKHPCAMVGCPELTSEKYCAKHQAEYEKIKASQPKKKYERKPDKDRPNSSQRGYGARWQKARRWYLKRHPLCQMCEAEGRLTPATQVHHKIKHNGNYQLFWNRSLWVGLCASCHSKLTVKGQ